MNNQKRLFEHLKTILPPDQKLVGVVMNTLNVKQDTAYRYIRGATGLPFERFEILCTKFDLSMDVFLQSESEKSILFQYRPITESNGCIRYMKELAEGLYTVSRASEKEFIIAARTIPFIHLVKYPELAFFKLYVWYSALNKDIKSLAEFCEIAKENGLADIYKKIYDCYEKIPSTEIWTPQTIDATLKMLEYHHDIGAFNGNEELLRRMVDQLQKLIDTVERYATAGYKGEGNNKTSFALHICPVDVENDFIMIRKDDQWCCIEKRYAINRIFTVDQYICNETLQWVEYLYSQSVKISGNTAQKERCRFFNETNNKVRAFIQKINI